MVYSVEVDGLHINTRRKDVRYDNMSCGGTSNATFDLCRKVREMLG